MFCDFGRMRRFVYLEVTASFFFAMPAALGAGNIIAFHVDWWVGLSERDAGLGLEA